MNTKTPKKAVEEGTDRMKTGNATVSGTCSNGQLKHSHILIIAFGWCSLGLAVLFMIPPWLWCVGATIEAVDNIACEEEVIDINSRNRVSFACDNNAHAVHDGNGKYRCVCGK